MYFGASSAHLPPALRPLLKVRFPPSGWQVVARLPKRIRTRESVGEELLDQLRPHKDSAEPSPGVVVEWRCEEDSTVDGSRTRSSERGVGCDQVCAGPLDAVAGRRRPTEDELMLLSREERERSAVGAVHRCGRVLCPSSPSIESRQCSSNGEERLSSSRKSL